MRLGLSVEHLHLLIIGNIGMNISIYIVERQGKHGLISNLYTAVLNPSAVITLILMFHFLFIGHYELVVFIRISITTTAHLFLRQTGLFAVTFVHLCFEDLKFVELCLTGISQTTVTRRTMLQTKPEVGELVNHLRIVTDGITQIARLLQQQGAVEECHKIIGFQPEHKVEVLDSTIVITHLSTKQTTIIMAKEVVGIKIECRIVISHCPTKSVLIITGHRTIDVITGILGLQVDGLRQEVLSLLPFLMGQTDDSTLCPDAGIVRVQFQTLIERLHRLHRIFLQKVDLSLHGIGSGIFRPTGKHGVNLRQSAVIVFLVDTTEDAVMPHTLVIGIETQGPCIVFYRSLIFLLVDTTEASQFIDIYHIWVSFDGFCTVTLRPSEVIQIEFGYASEEPRLIEIGFG